MTKTITITILITFLLTACFSNEAAYPNPASYPNPSYPNPSQSPDDYLPNPADSNLNPGAAYVDLAELLTMESFPLQFSLHLTGSLPNPCYQLRISPGLPDTENNINVDVYSVVSSDAICVQTTKSFDVNFPLGSYPSGHYILFVNGTQVAEFDA